jgi:hemoglobin
MPASSPPHEDSLWNPFTALGGEGPVRALAERFYDEMEAHEPELARLHQLEAGRVSRGARERFALFLIGWLGGPEDYVKQYGHPRLRMRHAHVPVNTAMRDAWLRSMRRALDAQSFEPEARSFVETRLAEVADFLRNQPE